MMKTTIPLLISLIFILFIGCSDKEPTDEIDVIVEEEIIWEESHTISEFVTAFTGASTVTDENVIFSGVVTSSDASKNITKSLYLQDASGAISIGIDDDALFEKFAPGTELYFYASGMSYSVGDNSVSMPSGVLLSGDSLDNRFKVKALDQSFFSKTVTSFSQLSKDDRSKLVKVYGYQFEESLVGEPLSINSTNTDRTLQDSDGNQLLLRINAQSTFSSSQIPFNSGSVEAILLVENDQFILLPIDEQGLNFSSTRHSLFQKKTFEKGGNVLPYQIMFPRDYKNSEQYPLVIFLHGAGERGTNNTSQMANGPGTFVNQTARADYPALVVFPQCPNTDMWSRRIKETINGELIFEFPVEDEPNMPMGMVIDLVKQLVLDEGVDESQIYVMGLSMGGIGTLEFLYYAPELPAAAISIAGGHDPAHVNVYGDIPIRLYHGSNDGVVPPKYSRDLIAALDQLPNEDAEYFEAEGRGHEWNYVLNDETAILPWLFTKIKDQE